MTARDPDYQEWLEDPQTQRVAAIIKKHMHSATKAILALAASPTQDVGELRRLSGSREAFRMVLRHMRGEQENDADN